MKKVPYRPFSSLLPNLLGQDYFVGDIHGEYAKLSKKLQELRFNPFKDRLICVGDLVDRGEYSDLVIEWLQQPFFHTVRGNHENMFLRWWSYRNQPSTQKKYAENIYFPNGGEWVKDIEMSELIRIAHSFEDLPYFLAIPNHLGRTIGVVHAELPNHASWPTLLESDINEELIQTMTCGRTRSRQVRGKLKDTDIPFTDNHIIKGLDALVCGHTLVKKPTFIGNILYLDTGPWYPQGNGYFSILSFNEILRTKDIKD